MVTIVDNLKEAHTKALKNIKTNKRRSMIIDTLYEISIRVKVWHYWVKLNFQKGGKLEL
ncbi:15803_t:CDS:1, partial [Gigaspora margarita]